MRVCSFSERQEEDWAGFGVIAHLVVSRKFVFHGFQLCNARDGDGPVHDVVLLEEFCEHLCGAQRVDIWGDEKDDGGRGGEGGATVCGKDGAVSLAVGRA